MTTLIGQHNRITKMVKDEMELTKSYLDTGLISQKEYINKIIPLTEMISAYWLNKNEAGYKEK